MPLYCMPKYYVPALKRLISYDNLHHILLAWLVDAYMVNDTLESSCMILK